MVFRKKKKTLGYYINGIKAIDKHTCYSFLSIGKPEFFNKNHLYRISQNCLINVRIRRKITWKRRNK